MQAKSRILISLSALLLIIAYFLPLWRIELEAPQYPEGLGMKIWLHGITGNIAQINGLNHYIGMKHIVPADFIEFQLVPYIYSVLILSGILAAIKGCRTMLKICLFLLLAFATAGLIDFYVWEYNYGHNLDPTAAIKIDGMSYQPPLIGYKQLLNFLAGSFPDWGGMLIAVSIAIVAGVFFYERRLIKQLR